jgi:hypothetical protein
VLTLNGAIAASAQECQTTPLPYDSEQRGVLNASDCSFPWKCGDELDIACAAPGEYWTLTAGAGEVAAVTVCYVSNDFVGASVYDDSGQELGQRQELGRDRRCGRVWFAAPATGVYRVRLSSTTHRYPQPPVSPFAIRAERVTRPLPGLFEANLHWQDRNFDDWHNWVDTYWSGFVSGTPISGYVLEVGSKPGASDIGTFQMGTSFGATFADVPPNIYYARVRAWNEFGWSEPTVERRIAVSRGTTLHAVVADRLVTLTWTGPLQQPWPDVADYFELLVGSSPGASDLGRFKLSPYMRAVFPDVPPGVYYLRVRLVPRNPCWVAESCAPSNEVVVTVH